MIGTILLQAGCVGEGPDVPGHLSLLRSPVLRARGAPTSLHEDQVASSSTPWTK